MGNISLFTLAQLTFLFLIWCAAIFVWAPNTLEWLFHNLGDWTTLLIWLPVCFILGFWYDRKYGSID